MIPVGHGALGSKNIIFRLYVFLFDSMALRNAHRDGSRTLKMSIPGFPAGGDHGEDVTQNDAHDTARFAEHDEGEETWNYGGLGWKTHPGRGSASRFTRSLS